MAAKYWLDTAADGNWSTATNWSGGTVPVNSDDVYLENGSRDITLGLAQSAVALASLNIAQSWTGAVGSASAYLAIGATKARIGYHDNGTSQPAGSGRIKVDFGSSNVAVVIENTATTPTDTDLAPVRLLLNHSSATVEVRNGTVGIAATYETETSTVGEVSVTGSAASLKMSDGVTITTLNTKAGNVVANGALPALEQTGGTLTVNGSGAVGSAVVDGGTFIHRTTGATTTLAIGRAGTADLSQDARAKTVANCTMQAGATLLANTGNPASVTFTNGIDLVRCNLQLSLIHI
jgi:hypothetical protein